MLRTPSILVTGAAGLIGGAVCHRLARRGARIVALDDLSAGSEERLPEDLPLIVGDARDEGLLRDLLDGEGPFDAILHLAGRVGVRRVLEDPEGCRQVTRELTAALCAAVGSLAPSERPRLLAASTSEVYQDLAEPVAEDSPLRSVSDEGRFAYAAARLELERDLTRLAAEGGGGAILLRLFNVTGPGQDAASGMVLPRFLEAAAQGEALEIFGDGQQVRTFAHVDDVAEDLASLLIEGPAFSGPLNLGGGTRTTILALAQEILRRCAAPSAHLAFVDPRLILPGFEEVRSRVPDLTRARALGLCRRTRSLENLVADLFLRHGEALSPCESPAS